MTLLYIGGEHHIFVAELSFNSAGFPSLKVKQSSDVGAMPSFLAFSPTQPILVAVAEGADRLVSLRAAGDGTLSPISEVSCPGGPAYVAIHPTGRFAFAASYGSGETRSFALSEKGELSPAVSTVQTGKFSHCAVPFDGEGQQRIACASKGTDLVSEMLFNVESGILTLSESHSLPPGSGPRHIVFSAAGDRAYVSGENDCSLMLMRRQNGSWQLSSHEIALAAAQQQGDSGADVHLSTDGRFVYLSLRGEDALVVYRVEDDALELVERHSSRGKVPRNFCLLGDEWLVLANQESANLSVFLRDKQQGTLEYRGTLETPERAFWVGNSGSR